MHHDAERIVTHHSSHHGEHIRIKPDQTLRSNQIPFPQQDGDIKVQRAIRLSACAQQLLYSLKSAHDAIRRCPRCFEQVQTDLAVRKADIGMADWCPEAQLGWSVGVGVWDGDGELPVATLGYISLFYSGSMDEEMIPSYAVPSGPFKVAEREVRSSPLASRRTTAGEGSFAYCSSSLINLFEAIIEEMSSEKTFELVTQSPTTVSEVENLRKVREPRAETAEMILKYEYVE
jgi:hypothetical protein